MTLRVVVVGARGRLGSFACELLGASPGFELVARANSTDDLEALVRASRPDVAFETTRAGLGAEHARRLLAAGVRPLVATSGVSAAELAELDRAARELGLGGLVAPNLSRGMWLLQRAADEAARHMGHAEIFEMHHARKADRPSGTALDTARRVAEVWGRSEPPAIHSMRLPGLVAHQVVAFGDAGEIYSLRHDVTSPAAYGPGILAGLRYVSRAEGFGLGIGLAFEAAR